MNTSQAAAILGRKGGLTTGPTKARTTKQCREAANRRWRKWHDNYAERVWKFVDKRSNEECWPHKCCGKRYGQLMFKRLTLCMHRRVWELVNGQIPDGLKVLHECDNPKCCNPKHLFLGTQKENVRDCIRKQRRSHWRGTKNGCAKLTDAQVLEIRMASSQGESGMSLAKRFGVDPGTISSIRLRRTWTHI